MSYETYRIVHIFGVILLFVSLGTLTAVGASTDSRLRKLAAIAHGVALALILVAGFGLLARLKMFGAFPVWVWFKLGIWLVLAAAVAPMRRKPEWAVWLWLSLPLVGGFAAWLAVTKPF
jgi:heme A synthase